MLDSGNLGRPMEINTVTRSGQAAIGGFPEMNLLYTHDYAPSSRYNPVTKIDQQAAQATKPTLDANSVHKTPTVADLHPAIPNLGRETPIANDETFAIRRPEPSREPKRTHITLRQSEPVDKRNDGAPSQSQ